MRYERLKWLRSDVCVITIIFAKIADVKDNQGLPAYGFNPPLT